MRATGMHGSPASHIQRMGADVIFADVTSRAEVEPLVDGMDYVFNVAGDTSLWRRSNAQQWKVNVEGPAVVSNACLNAGVQRLIHTSTVDVFGYDPDGGPVDEDTGTFNFDNIGYHYGETKVAGDAQVRAVADKGLDVVLIHPGMMIGPYDHTLQMGRVFFDLKNGKMPGTPAGGSSFCHVTEVAQAHIAAAEKGRSGESYICGGDTHTNLTYLEVFERIAKAVGGEAPSRTFPEWAMVAYGSLCETLSFVTNQPPDMNPGMARYVSRPQYASSDKAIRELGYQISDIDVAIQDALAWYKEQNYAL